MVDGKKKNNKSQYQKPTARTNANQDQEVSCGGAIDANNGRSSNRSAASPILDGGHLIYVSPTRVCVLVCSIIFAQRRHCVVLGRVRPDLPFLRQFFCVVDIRYGFSILEFVHTFPDAVAA